METAKLFKNGRSQAVRLPKKYRFRGETVYIKKMGKAVVLLPQHGTWQLLIESVDLFSNDFMRNRNQPARQPRASRAK